MGASSEGVSIEAGGSTEVVVGGDSECTVGTGCAAMECGNPGYNIINLHYSVII